MTLSNKSNLAAIAAVALVLTASSSALAELPLVDHDGWRLSTDGRVNSFLSIGEGTGIPDGQPGDSLGAGTTDTQDSTGGLHSARIRNGFLMSVLAFTGKKEVNPNFKVTTRVALWMNITGSRTKNNPAQTDPRELWGEIAGNWGSFRGGSDLALFGRGGILVDSRIAHEYGLGYPCGVRDASGGACGMTAFGAPFPGYEPGMVYATPTLFGLQVSLGLYDPATIGNAQLDRAPLPRFEGEVKYEYKDIVRVFGSGFWQVLEGTVPDTNPAAMGRQKDLHTNAWGAQGGAMLALGPIMLGGAAYQGAGFSPITSIDEGVVAADQAGVLRNSWGAFGLGAVLIDPLHLKIAGGAGVWHLDKNATDSGATNNGVPSNPALIKQNFGATVGVYQTTGPVHFALEYFRAQHTWYDQGVASAADPNVTASIITPKQTVNFINAGTTITW
jgi:hypothetical protein